jgi:hypothetical protein
MSTHKPIISVISVTEEKDEVMLVSSTGFEVGGWSRLFTELPSSVNQIVINGKRILSGFSGMSIDDVVIQQCSKFGE